MTDPKRPCCRPASAHYWQPLPGNAEFLSCAKCGRLANYQRGGRLGNRGRIRLYNYPEMEASIRRRYETAAPRGESPEFRRQA
jgi:hypothetical protein